MKYTIAPEVFKLNPHLHFGVLVGTDMINSPSTPDDTSRLRAAENHVRKVIPVEDLRNQPNVSGYRTTMEKAGINPNKYAASIEAMLKRVLKGAALPDINSMVDLCNAISLETQISLGGHDLRDMPEDLAVRFTTGIEKFLPFGATEYEDVEANELVFTSGNIVQTRKWVWRQSELGKMNLDTNHVFFQLVGFESDPDGPFIQAVNGIETLIEKRFGGKSKKFIVTRDNPSIEF